MPRGIYKRVKRWKRKPCSEETKKKIGDGNRGKKVSPETIEKLRKSHIGQIGYWTGKKRSKEDIEKFRLSHLGKPSPKKGTKLSEEIKKKVSEGLLRSKLNKGENHYNWKGGINPVNDTIRKSYEYRLWHDSCLERDNYTCQISGKNGVKLNVHHINNFADFPELRTSIENGITMTEELHTKFHKIYGNKNNTREQLEEFISNYED